MINTSSLRRSGRSLAWSRTLPCHGKNPGPNPGDRTNINNSSTAGSIDSKNMSVLEGGYLCSAVLRLLWGKDLEFIQIPKIQKVQGEEAVIALQSFVTELEHNKERKLTKKQKRTLKKIADSLIISINEEMQNKKDKKLVLTFPEQNPFVLFKRIFPWIPR